VLDGRLGRIRRWESAVVGDRGWVWRTRLICGVRWRRRYLDDTALRDALRLSSSHAGLNVKRIILHVGILRSSTNSGQPHLSAKTVLVRAGLPVLSFGTRGLNLPQAVLVLMAGCGHFCFPCLTMGMFHRTRPVR
jgi:hypothetical protein